MKKLSALQTSYLCEQIAMLLQSGIPLYDGIAILADETTDVNEKSVLNNISENLAKHQTFSNALLNTNVFDTFLIKMIEIGELSGYLDKTIDKMANYYRYIDELNKTVKNAISYPLVLLAMMFVVLGILVIKVLPIFQNIINDLGGELSVLNLQLMQIGKYLADYSFIILLILILIIVLVTIIYQLHFKKQSLLNQLYMFYPTRKLANQLYASQVSFSLSLLINSGYNIQEALDIIKDLATNQYYKNKMQGIIDQLKTQTMLDEILASSKLFLPIFQRMIVVGYRCGHGVEALDKVSSEYEVLIISRINRFLNIIEPTMVGVLALIVGIILLSVMMPLLSIMGSIG